MPPLLHVQVEGISIQIYGVFLNADLLVFLRCALNFHAALMPALRQLLSFTSVTGGH